MIRHDEVSHRIDGASDRFAAMADALALPLIVAPMTGVSSAELVLAAAAANVAVECDALGARRVVRRARTILGPDHERRRHAARCNRPRPRRPVRWSCRYNGRL